MLRSTCAHPPSRPYALTCSHVCARKTSMANTRKQHALAGMGKARAGRCRACAHEGHVQVGAWRAQARERYAHTQGFVHVGLWRRRFVLQVVFVEHTQCTEQSTRRGIVCGSPGVLPCSTGLPPLRVSSPPVAQLLHHRARPPCDRLVLEVPVSFFLFFVTP